MSRSYLFLGIVIALAALSGWLFTQRKFNYGLDVEGGVRLTYDLDFSKADKDVPKSEYQNRVIKVMERRAIGMSGVVEPYIVAKGTDSIIIELPGNISLEQARSIMGKTAQLEWYHATNINTAQANYRPYNVSNEDKDASNPEVKFYASSNPSKLIKPSDPEYKTVLAGWKQILRGEDLASAYADTSGGSYWPAFRFTPEGGRKMEAWCRSVFGREEQLAAVLDGTCISMAPLEKDAVINTNGYIRGTFTSDYVRELVTLLNSGALPVGLKETSAIRVDPTIGRFAKDQIVNVGAIAFGVIALFLLAYYAFPGFVALLALGLYVLFTLSALKFINATFSLAAIAGFILSVGMAVDANILVFERFKEEMRDGRSLKTAMDLGFKRAFPAILDSNACTIITSLILYGTGQGPVKGFATTMIIGVAISLFTAVTVTRSLLLFLVESGMANNKKWYATERSWFGEAREATADTNPIKVLEKSKLYFGISLATIVPGIIFFAMGGLKPNVEFQGGFEAQFKVADDAAGRTIQQNLKQGGAKNLNMKFADGLDEQKKPVRLAIFTVPKEGPFNTDDAGAAQAKLVELSGQKKEDITGFQFVGGSVRAETVTNTINGIIGSSVAIVLYLALRFGFALGGFIIGLRFALSVIAALVHDILVVVGLAAIGGYLFGWEVSALFISGMLTVIGFSTHDTIVIFDRIRENLRHPLPNEDLAHLVNRSITKSLARSINTSMTVIVTLILLIAFGSATPELRLFNATMLFGIISGTYSSIFNAAPILYFWDRAVGKKHEENTMLALARSAASRVRLTRETAPVQTQAAASESYGTVKRRRRASESATQYIDDEP